MIEKILHPDNPRRPVDWRWERARIALQKGISRRRDDTWICKAARYKRDFDNCREDTDWYALVDKYPDLTWAHDLATNNGVEGGTLKSALEARILARDDWDRIAKRARTRPDVIEAYEAVFFNVRPELDNEDYVLHQVMGPSLHLGFQEQEYDLIWKLFGYKGGPAVLDALIGVIDAAPRPQSTAEAGAWMADVTRQGLKRKGLLAVHLVRINNFNAVEFIDKVLKLFELERDAPGGGAGATEGMLENVKVMMNSLGAAFTVGKRPGGADPSPLSRYDNQHAELRYDEVMALGGGRELPHATELVSLAFPEPRGRDREPPADRR